MKLYFTRHGESEANRLRIISNRDLPHPLTETGRRQAADLAEKLRGKPLTHIFASPLQRARQTGEILSTALNVPLTLEDDLREPDCGVLEGRGDPEAWAEQKYWLDSWLAGHDLDKGPTGGETYNAVRERFTRFIDKFMREYGKSPAEFVFVSHGEAMLLGLPGLVENLDTHYMWEHGLSHAGLLMVECVNEKLIFKKSGAVN